MGGSRGVVKPQGLLLVVCAFDWSESRTPKEAWLCSGGQSSLHVRIFFLICLARTAPITAHLVSLCCVCLASRSVCDPDAQPLHIPLLSSTRRA